MKVISRIGLERLAGLECLCGPLRLIPHYSSIGQDHIFWAIPGGKKVTTTWLREFAAVNGWFFHVND